MQTMENQMQANLITTINKVTAETNNDDDTSLTDTTTAQDMHSILMPAMPIKQAFCEK